MLSALANRFGTDKGTAVAAGHGYTLVYELIFGQVRERITDLLEIGLARGGPEVPGGSAERDVGDIPSVRMWREFFPQARIVGVDISDCSPFVGDRFDFVRADCGDPAQLERVAGLGREFDVIVDDGSHAPYHQQLSFRRLFPLLRPAGFYIIEDLHWQPEEHEAPLPPAPRTDILFERFLRTGAFGNDVSPTADWNRIAGEIAAVYLFDEDWLASHRRQVNVRGGFEPELETRIDTFDAGRRTLKALAGQALRRLRSAARGPEHPSRYPAVKLAIVRKRGPP